MKNYLLTKLLKVLAFLFLLMFTFSTYGQDGTIKGAITDNNKEPLIGVTIKVVGTVIGTVTDIDGKYILSNASPDASLEVSYVGMKTQIIHVKGRNTIDIVLLEDLETLDDLVVIAYGTQKKISVTGSIAAIETKEIKQTPAPNLAMSLAGRLPGLTVIQRSGEPGRDVVQMHLRGLGTLNGRAPIILVDGIERDMTYIDSNEIEDVTILKDAPSTAVYGVRGANGVILITTKRGTSETPEINFTTELSLQDFPRFMKPVNSYQHAILKNQVLTNDGLEKQYSAEEIEKFRTGEDPLRYPNTNWRKELVNDFSLQHRYNLNVSGNIKAVRYFINAGYLNQGGMFKTEKDLEYDPTFKLDRYNFRSNIDVQLTNDLEASLNLGGYLEEQNMPMGVLHIVGPNVAGNLMSQSPAWHILAYMNDLPPTLPGPTTEDGGVVTSNTWPHPAYGQLNRSGYAKQSRNHFTTTYSLKMNLDRFVEGLSTKVTMSADAHTINNQFASRAYEKYVHVIDKNLKDSQGRDSVYFRPFNDDQNTPLSISGGSSYSILTNIQANLQYNRTINKHDLAGLFLFQQQKTTHGYELPYNLRGLAGRLSYGYDYRYFAEFNAGYNGSEQFAKGSRYGFFPAFSGAWVVSNESFLENSLTLTYLKLRASYGLVGNDQIGGSRFLYLDDIQILPGGMSSIGKGQYINIALLRNERLKWEVAKKTNLGIELGFFKTISLNIDYFTEKRSNILTRRRTIPQMNGFPSHILPPVNIGIIDNKGYEVELGYTKTINNVFFFQSRFNVNYAKNNQVFVDEPLLPEDYPYRYRSTGYRIGQPFGYIVEGYFNDEDEIATSPEQIVGGRPTKPGDFKYKDVNGDGVVDLKDVSPIGYSSVPDYTFGLNLSMNYKNLGLRVLFQGVTHVSNFYADRGTFSKFFYVERHLESWTEERAKNNHRISYPRMTEEGSPNEILNTFFLEDASYIRLKNVELGYTFPKSISKLFNARDIRIYTNGFNLYTWDRLPTKNFDVEVVDSFTYPNTRFFNFGVNVVF